jgi:hypothetical protein
MKLRVIVSILFIIITTFTAIHEIEHIGGEHDSSTCQICMLNDHLASVDIVDTFKSIEFIKFDKITFRNITYNYHKKIHTNQNRAPPSIS